MEPARRTLREPISNPGEGRETLDRVLVALRPKLHRYCARMTGSVIDGEDLVQEALTKAIEAFPRAESIAYPEAWVFRIAHNTGLNFLKRQARQSAARSDDDPDMIADPRSDVAERESAAESLRTFASLPVAQRASVILMDVLGYSLDEIKEITGASIAAIKANLHRGRKRLRELAHDEGNSMVPLAAAERSRLSLYLDCFNDRDFDAIKRMLADDVRLDVAGVTRTTGRGKVEKYFGNYAKRRDWCFELGYVDGRPALIEHRPADPGRKPVNFIVVEWTDGKVTAIRDFVHRGYALDGANVLLETAAG